MRKSPHDVDVDVLIIGAGHNGLVAAAYLLKAGLRVTLLERRDRVGGPGARVEWIPGYSSSVTNSPGSLEPKIVEDLELERFGLRFVKPDPTLIHPLEGGRLFAAHRDRELTAMQLDSFAVGEADRYDGLFRHLERFARKLGVSLFSSPPTLKVLVRRLETLQDQTDFARIFFGSATELLNLHLESQEAKAIVGTLATVSGPGSPRIPGTAVNLLMRPLSLASSSVASFHDPRQLPLRGSTGLPINGMGAVVDAMEQVVLQRGANIRRKCEVTAILIDGGRATGVATEDGDEFYARAIVSAVSPRSTVLDLVPDLDEWMPFKALMRAKEFRGDECKVVLAIDGAPRWRTNGSGFSPEEVASAQFRIAPTLDYIEDAYADRLKGEIPSWPVIWGLTPSMTSPNLAPKGHHIMSLNVGAPTRLRQGSWDDSRELMISRCVKALSEWIPDLAGQVVDARCITPEDLERELSMAGTEICHGEMLPANQFWLRPLPGLHDYRTPTQGLYLSGAGTWPGNFFSGIPGFNTSQALLTDLAAEARTSKPSQKGVLL